MSGSEQSLTSFPNLFGINALASYGASCPGLEVLSSDTNKELPGNRLALLVPGEVEQVVPTRFTLIDRGTCFNHEMGVFLVDDEQGRIGDLLPGDDTYAAVALSLGRRYLVFAYGQATGVVTELGLRSQQHIGFYLIQDATTEDFLQQNPANQLGYEPLAFFSLPKANPDGIDHLLELSPNRIGWEDLTGSCDWDFNDLVCQFEFTAPVTEPDISLQEESFFQACHRQTIQLPQTASSLSFTYTCLNFDSTDLDSIKDAFEVALVDEDGKSLVQTFAPNRDAFFNITEGQPVAIAPGVRLEGQTVQVNLAGLVPGSMATLIFRLVNNDRDIDTNVHIEEIKLQVGDGTLPPALVPPMSFPVSKWPIDFTQLVNLSDSLTAQYGRTSFNDRTRRLYADLAIQNVGQYRVDGSLLVAIANISHPTVQVVEADGVTPNGLPYYDFTAILIPALQPGNTSATRTLAFFNPQRIQFTYTLVLLGQVH